MKLISTKPTIVDGIEYPFLAVSISMSSIWKPGLGASTAIRFTPFRELKDGTFESLPDQPKAISLMDIFETAEGDAALENAVQGIMTSLQTLVNEKNL